MTQKKIKQTHQFSELSKIDNRKTNEVLYRV